MDPFQDIGLGLILLTFDVSFAACFFSSLSGGGAGLILLPVLLFTGRAFINALASHKLAVGDAAIVSAQDPVVLGDFSAPHPDLALLRWRDDFYTQAHPGPADILVVVEVADSTLAHDRDRKRPLYARFAVPEVCLVDLAGGHLDVYRDPEDGAYTARFRVQDLSCVGIGALPEVALNLRSLF